MKYEIDFHCHTIASDGLSTIPRLAEIAKERGLGALVVTDHCYSHGSYYANKAVMKTLESLAIKLPVPVIVGAEIYTPFGEFLLFGQKAISNWYHSRDHLKKTNQMFGVNSYWKMFKDHVCFGGSLDVGGVDEYGEWIKRRKLDCELPYAMIMCHPGKDANFYSQMPDEMYEILHGYEIGNSGTLWRDHDSGRRAVDMLKSKIKKPRELTNSDVHKEELGEMRNIVEIPDGKELDEGWLIHWLRNK